MIDRETAERIAGIPGVRHDDDVQRAILSELIRIRKALEPAQAVAEPAEKPKPKRRRQVRPTESEAA